MAPSHAVTMTSRIVGSAMAAPGWLSSQITHCMLSFLSLAVPGGLPARSDYDDHFLVAVKFLEHLHCI
jgi:hypothetical protein